MEIEESSYQEVSSLPQLQLSADVAEAVRKPHLTLVGKIISGNPFKSVIVHMIVRRIWFTQEPITMDQISLNTFIFSFKCVADRDRVWNRSPWTINGAHLALKAWRPEMSIRDFDFSHSTFWIQIRGLPLQYMSKENGLKIGGLFKEVLKCEDNTWKNFLGMKYLCVQVEGNHQASFA